MTVPYQADKESSELNRSGKSQQQSMAIGAEITYTVCELEGDHLPIAVSMLASLVFADQSIAILGGRLLDEIA